MSPPQWRKEKMDRTGSGVGGSGGVKEGRVKEVVLERTGHLVAMEAVDACADAAATWLGQELKRWREEEDAFQQDWSRRPSRDKLVISEEAKKLLNKALSKGGPTRKAKL